MFVEVCLGPTSWAVVLTAPGLVTAIRAVLHAIAHFPQRNTAAISTAELPWASSTHRHDTLHNAEHPPHTTLHNAEHPLHTTAQLC